MKCKHLFALLFTTISSFAGTEDYPFPYRYSRAEAVKRIQLGGVALGSTYNELLFDHVRFLTPDDNPDPADTSNKGFRKEDYLVPQLLVQNGEKTLQTIKNGEYFEIPMPDGDLQIFSYIIERILGHEGALTLSTEQQNTKNLPKRENWIKINQFLLDHKSGPNGFFTASHLRLGHEEEDLAIIRDYETRRRTWWVARSGGDPLDKLSREDYLKGLAEALSQYEKSQGKAADNLFQLVSKGMTLEAKLFYHATDQSLPLATYYPKATPDAGADAAWLSIPSENGSLLITLSRRGILSGKPVTK